jgi:hypothetical protein
MPHNCIQYLLAQTWRWLYGRAETCSLG